MTAQQMASEARRHMESTVKTCATAILELERSDAVDRRRARRHCRLSLRCFDMGASVLLAGLALQASPMTGERASRGFGDLLARRRGGPTAERRGMAARVGQIHLIRAMTGHRGLFDPWRVRTSRHPSGPGPAEVLLDDLLDGYVDWRESARAVADAYDRWSFASGAERAVRFAAYTATLDQEQKTAAAYAETVTDVERWLQRRSRLPPAAPSR